MKQREETFEDYLMEIHCKNNPEILDDDLSDHFNDWLGELDVDDLIDYANKFAQKIRKDLLSNKPK